MGMVSAITHEFCRGKINDDGSGLFASICYVNRSDDGTKINSQRLRSVIADYIRRNKNLHDSILKNDVRFKTIQDYYKQLEQGKLSGGEIELKGAAISCHLVIHVISLTRNTQNKYDINILNYGEDIKSFKECVYILYDEENKHYEPLYVVNKQNSNEILTIFQRDDDMVRHLLDKFIQEEFGDHVCIQSDCPSSSYENEQLSEYIHWDETARIPDLIRPNASGNSPIKRKLPDYASLSFAKIVDEFISTSIPNNNCDLDKPVKSSKWDTHETSTSNDSNYESMTIEKHLQMDLSSYGCCMYETEDFLAEQLTKNSLMNSNKKHQGHGMEFEFPPALGFRGRTIGDFKLKPTRYFQDRAGHRCLNLLIPNTHLTADLFRTCLEICLVTREINGYTYIHPYFVFQGHPTDPLIPNVNPIYQFLDSKTELKDYFDNLRQQLKLKLCVIMRKNKELMKAKQPLQIFSSPTINNNGPLITTIYTDHRNFKEAYHLHDLRFAITLWQKQSGEEQFRRCDDTQHISEISTAKRKYTKSS